MTYIDSHAHLTMPGVALDVSAILDRAQKADVEAVINICTDSESLAKGIKYVSSSVLVVGLK